MKNSLKRRMAGIAAALVIAGGTGTGLLSEVTGGIVPDIVVSADAASMTPVTFINSKGESKTVASYKKLTSSTSVLKGGYYVVTGTVRVDNLTVSKNSGIVLTSGSKLVVPHGIYVESGVQLNIYSQKSGSGSLFAGTTDGSDNTSWSKTCGIGGVGAEINILGGKVYAKGGTGSYGIQGSKIRIQHTNSTDRVFASSYSKSVNILNAFVDKKAGKAYRGTSISADLIKGATLEAAKSVTAQTKTLSGDYAVFDTVRSAERLNVNGTANLFLGDNATLSVSGGVNVTSGNKLNIYGTNGTLYAGSETMPNYYPGIGASDNFRTGDIVINGGRVVAVGGTNAAGIGGNGAYIQIKSGDVNATAGAYASAIGSNANDSGADIKITGGNVKATATAGGHGIGSGSGSAISYIYLTLGDVGESIFATDYNGNIDFGRVLYTSDNTQARTDNIAGRTLSLRSRYYETSYEIKFNTNGGNAISPLYVGYNKTVSSLPTPVRNGYYFDGWYTDSSLTTRFDSRRSINSDMTLYARWIPGYYNYYSSYYNYYDYPNYYDYYNYFYDYGYYGDYYDNYWNYYNNYYNNYYGYYYGMSAYTVMFDTDGAGTIDPIYVPAGQTIPRMPYVYKQGYIFDGWYTDISYTSRFDTDSPVYGNITLYAKWIPNSYSRYTCSVNFVTNNGTSVGTRTVEYGRTLDVMPYVSRTGYIFDGWYIDENFTYRINENTPIFGNMTLYAKWIQSSEAVSTCQVYFDAGMGWFANGDILVTRTIRTGTSALSVLPTEPTYTTYSANYDFEGWYLDKNLTKKYNGEALYSNTILYAKYTPRYVVY